MAVYVEILIRAPMATVWAHTQTSSLHERWDLRFTDITPLEVADGSPNRFRYATRMAAGLRIEGEGESVGHRDLADGSRASVLRFWSGHPLSLIREGSGYWKYIPTPDGIRFLTSYDYRVRFGWLGRLIDRVAFRPLLGWATAWSFDRLRLWLERGIDPGLAVRHALVHGLARLGLAAIFLYHGLVPKLLAVHPDELAIVSASGIGPAADAIRVLGLAEVALAFGLMARWRSRALPLLGAGFAVAAVGVVAQLMPGSLAGAFNPVSLAMAVVALASIDQLTVPLLPNASSCRRRPIGGPS